MPHKHIRLALVGTAAVAVALMVAAIAVAGDGDELTPLSSDTPTATDAATDAPSEVPGTSPTAPPSSDEPATETPTDSPDDVAPDAAQGTGPIEGTTPALNPGGNCVELPNNSDVVQNPDKHPGWTIGGCDPADAPLTVDEDSGEEDQPGEGPPQGRTPSLNPDGVCVALPNTSNIVKNPSKHPKWVVGGCEIGAD